MTTKITNPTVWQQGYLARAAEEDTIKKALLAACKSLLQPDYTGGFCPWCGMSQPVGPQAHGLGCAVIDAAIAIALAEKETP